MFPIGFQRLFYTVSGGRHGADAAEARPLAECLSHGSLTDLEHLGQICWEFGAGKLGDLSDLSMDELGIARDSNGILCKYIL